MKAFIKTIIFAIAAGVVITLGFTGIRFFVKKRAEVTVLQAIERQKELFNDISYTDEIGEEKETSVYDVSAAADSAMPALVSVGVTYVSYSYDFFGREFSSESKGNASGIIAAQNFGEILIVTNNHVVDGSSSVNVTFINGKEVPAEVKSTEESEDLAVISVKVSDIDAETLSSIRIATFGDSDELVPGEMVIAIGNALGYGQSVTVGYVSALDREVTVDEYTLHLIQTDVAINPGNSGGALLNSRGEVIGINNAKIASEDVEGICYAIPSSTAIPIIDELMTRRTLPEEKQAYLGIKGQVVTEEQAKFYNLPRGIYIREVKSGSPADLAGVKPGDVLVAINGKTVLTLERYEKIVSYTEGGSEGTITIKRIIEGKYKEESLSVTFGFRSER